MINKSILPKNSNSFYISIALLLLCSLVTTGCDNNNPPYKFDMTRLNQDGSTNDGKDYTKQPWSCVRDNKTNLVWEVKKSEPGLQNANDTYSWYDPDKNTNGGWAGKANAGVCTGSDCDTKSYINVINAKKLCGFTDWHLPSREELSTLVDTSIFFPGPTISKTFFPEPLPPGKYWTDTTFRIRHAGAWAWRFDYGNDFLSEKSEPLNVRLTRGIPKTVGDGQPQNE